MAGPLRCGQKCGCHSGGKGACDAAAADARRTTHCAQRGLSGWTDSGFGEYLGFAVHVVPFKQTPCFYLGQRNPSGMELSMACFRVYVLSFPQAPKATVKYDRGIYCYVPCVNSVKVYE